MAALLARPSRTSAMLPYNAPHLPTYRLATPEEREDRGWIGAEAAVAEKSKATDLPDFDHQFLCGPQAADVVALSLNG